MGIELTVSRHLKVRSKWLFCNWNINDPPKTISIKIFLALKKHTENTISDSKLILPIVITKVSYKEISELNSESSYLYSYFLIIPNSRWIFSSFRIISFFNSSTVHKQEIKLKYLPAKCNSLLCKNPDIYGGRVFVCGLCTL